MNAFIRFASFVLVIAGLQACGSIPSDPYGYGGYHRPVVVPDRLGYQVETMPGGRSYVAVLNPDQTWTVDTSRLLAPGTAAPAGFLTAYWGHDRQWRINGNAVPDRLVVVNRVPQGFDGVYQPQVGLQSGVGVSAVASISAESAVMLLRELESAGNPCTAKNHNSRLTVGGVIGGLVGVVLTGDLRGLAFGALIGASGGSAEAKWNCVSYTRTRMVLLSVIDTARARCKSTLSQRETNGVLDTTKTKECTAIETMEFERIGQGQAQAAAAAPTPTPAASVPRRAAPAAARSWDGTGTPPSWVK